MMERDYAQYRDHENGNVLWKMKQAGEQLNILREVDFAVIFPSEEAAMDFAVRLLRFGHKVSVRGRSCVDTVLPRVRQDCGVYITS